MVEWPRRRLYQLNDIFPPKGTQMRGLFAQPEPADDLEAVPYFAEMTHEQRRAAAHHADWTIVTAGTRLQKRTMAVGWLWVAVEDPLELRHDDQLLGHVQPGDVWGEAPLLLGMVSPVDVVAAVDTTVVSLPARAFHGMLADAGFAIAVARRQAQSHVAATSPALSPGIALA